MTRTICTHCRSNARRTLLWKLVGIAVLAVILIVLGERCHADSLPAPLKRLLLRLDDPRQPQWKRDLAPMIRERRIGRFEARVTMFCPANPVDPLGGGAFAAWGMRLRRGHAAVGTRVQAAPFGTVLYCPSVIDHLLVIVDTGPGVQGRTRIDVCEPDPSCYRALDWANGTRQPCWRLGRVGRREAR